MKVIKKYIIQYPKSGVVQYKNLINQKDYISDIVPLLDKINEIERNYLRKKADSLIKPIKTEIKNKYGSHWFTDHSPLFFAIESGEMDLGLNQGGIHKVILREIKDSICESDIEY